MGRPARESNSSSSLGIAWRIWSSLSQFPVFEHTCPFGMSSRRRREGWMIPFYWFTCSRSFSKQLILHQRQKYIKVRSAILLFILFTIIPTETDGLSYHLGIHNENCQLFLCFLFSFLVPFPIPFLYHFLVSVSHSGSKCHRNWRIRRNRPAIVSPPQDESIREATLPLWPFEASRRRCGLVAHQHSLSCHGSERRSESPTSPQRKRYRDNHRWCPS